MELKNCDCFSNESFKIEGDYYICNICGKQYTTYIAERGITLEKYRKGQVSMKYVCDEFNIDYSKVEKELREHDKNNLNYNIPNSIESKVRFDNIIEALESIQKDYLKP